MPTTTTRSTLSIPSGQARVHGLDTLRALAITLVFFYHYQSFVRGAPDFGWLSAVGWTGVDLFFVLSGYLIADPLFAQLRDTGRLAPGRFYARRILRTLPDYLAVLAVYLLLPGRFDGVRPPPEAWRFLTFTQNIGLQPGTPFSHAWSLCVEEQFYLFLPLALAIGMAVGRRTGLGLRWVWAAGAALIGAAIAWRWHGWTLYGTDTRGAPDGYYPHLYYATVCRADEFLPGVGLALLKNFRPAAWEAALRRGHAWLAAGAVATLALFAGIVQTYVVDGVGYGWFMTAFGYSLLAIAFAALLLGAASPRTWLYRVRVPGADALARWSYAVYLTHKPLAVVLGRFLRLHGITGWAALACVVPACLVVGWLLFRAVETPFMRLRARWFPAPRPALSPVAGMADPAPPAAPDRLVA